MITRELIIKVISGNATGAETESVDFWRKKLPENEKLFQEITLYWKESLCLKREYNPNVNASWEKLREKLGRNQKRSRLFYKYAAAFFLVFSLVTLVVYFLPDSSNTPSNSQKRESVVLEEKKPTDSIQKKAPVLYKKKLFYLLADDAIKEEFLSDSTLVILNKHSQLAYNDFDAEGNRTLSLKGQAHFDVRKNGKEFVVSTKHIRVRVIGTSFAVNENKTENTIEVVVEEGKVEAFEIKNRTNKITITKGQKYVFKIESKKFIKVKSNDNNRWWNKFLSKLRNLFKRNKN